MLDIELKVYIEENNQTENELKELDENVRITYDRDGNMCVMSDYIIGYVSARPHNNGHYLHIYNKKDRNKTMTFDISDVESIYSL